MKRQSILVLVFLIAIPTFADLSYYVIDLGVLPGDWSNRSYAYSINDAGNIVGGSFYGGSWRATLFDSSGGGNNIYLGNLYSDVADSFGRRAYSINNNDQIVGVAEAGGVLGEYPALFDPTGGADNTNLGYLGAEPGGGMARSISDNGQIVGYSYVENINGDKRPHAALYNSSGNGNNIDLGTLPGHDMSYAYSINNAGQAVGYSRYSVEQGGRATLFDLSGNDNNIDLGTLGGLYSEAEAINNLGEIVGGARPASGGGHATLFDPTGSGNNINLGTLGGEFSHAWAINDIGQIVGQAADVFGDYRATLFDPKGSWQNINLNTLIDPLSGWDLQYAMDINNYGWIVGWGINPDGYERAFLLVPEPVNSPPVADGGPDQTVEQDSVAGAEVQLDGSGSSDPDGDPLSYLWTWGSETAVGINPTVTLPPGLTTIILTVSDGQLSDEDTVDITVIDTIAPQVEIIGPQPNAAVQDTVTFLAEASDISEVTDVYFYVREPDGASGTPIGYEELPATLTTTPTQWEYAFDTTALLDGHYVILAKAIDSYGNEGWSEVVPFSIRNWALLELLPASESYNAGRTIPVKFSLRVAESVDPETPFVYNEDLEIRIYDVTDPDTILQTSLHGDTSRDYRIDGVDELYITNFKTSKQPAVYEVEIWRLSTDFLIDSFNFETVKVKK